MAPAIFLALALFSADDTVPPEAPFPAGAPTDDYGLVSWCYGALSSHMSMQKQVMPEVERIERQWAKDDAELKEDMQSYEEQRIEGVRAVAQFRRAMEAAEKASVKPIQMEGAAAVKKGAGIWSGFATTDKRTLAQEWMSWGLPARCVPTAKGLEKKASLFGQALNFNAPAAEPEPTPSLDDLIAQVADAHPAPVNSVAATGEVEAPAVVEEAPAAEEAAPEEAAPSLRGVQ